jgi:hypothetical protein
MPMLATQATKNSRPQTIGIARCMSLLGMAADLEMVE